MGTGHAGTLAGPLSKRVFELSGALLTPHSLAGRILTGCVYEPQAPGTFGVLVTRDDPRTRWHSHSRRIAAPIRAHWAAFAPSVFLLTGHETACRARRCRGDGRCAGHAPLQLGWPAFAAAYRAELDRWPFLTRLAVARQIVEWLRSTPSLTILSFEQDRQTRLHDTDRGKAWAQRHIFREWVVDLLPLATPFRDVKEWTISGQMVHGQ